MSRKSELLKVEETKNFSEFSQLADFSLMNSLNADPDSKKDGNDHRARSVYSGHYVPVTPTPIPEPIYISHSKSLFEELGLSSDLIKDKKFCRFFFCCYRSGRESKNPIWLGDGVCIVYLWH